MKNNNLIRAWSGIGPDAAADERMKRAILAYNRSGAKEKERERMKTQNRKKIWVPLAACMALLIAVGVFFGAGGLGAGRYTVTLENGDAVTYKKMDVSSSSLDFAYKFGVVTRDLTAAELKALSPLLTSGFGTFRTDTGELVRFEGKAGDTKVIMTLPGLCVTDTVVDEFPVKNEVGGTEVLSGYCRANNGGKPVALFTGQFQLGGVIVYAEHGAPFAEAKTAAETLSQTVAAFIANGAPAFSDVTL